ncbi:cell wall-active antibiotics response protein LiaF [Bacillus sp. CGMCC 1.16541]|uniref:cell wall-active antibiotics response protein LiaF n=1 Tax=Bacillus sp. CGMCC 1.16541 TaxID=2185143 RepID=UPI000D729442|nr:cell wall-active antibiotics response protein LiaF [Bacillus sp. CGMCC 1.16541]
MKINKTDYMNWILLVGVVLLLLELSFFNGGLIFSLLVAAGCIYIGRRRLPKQSGKLLFWGGVIAFVFQILNMMTFQFFLLAVLIHLVLKFVQTKRTPTLIKPTITEPSITNGEVFKKAPLFQNTLFERQKTPEHVYEWNDINIQSGIGDTVIDLSYTVLPKGEAVIVTRHLIGNVQILVPYEVEVSVRHSAIAGNVKIFEHEHPKFFNQTICFQTAQYEEASQKIKIVTAMMTGDLEVKRI